MATVQGGDLNACELLLEAKADPSLATPDLITPLAWFVMHQLEEDIFTLLLAAKPNLEAKDMLNRTPLMLAALVTTEETSSELLDSGARTEARDYRGWTALHHACACRIDGGTLRVYALQELWSSQGLLARDKRGRSALWYALHNPGLSAHWLVALLEQAVEQEAGSWLEVAQR